MTDDNAIQGGVAEVRRRAREAMQKHGEVVASITDDLPFADRVELYHIAAMCLQQVQVCLLSGILGILEETSK